MKRYILAIVLSLGFIVPQHVQAAQPIPTTEPGILIAQIAEIQPMAETQLQPVQPLQMAAFSYDPMGTHPNAFEPLNCTWGAASMKGNIPADWGNANEWPAHAAAAGIKVSDQPIVGAIAVETAGTFGHVAVVVATPPGAVTVTEMNYDWQGSVRTYTYPLGHFNVYIWM